MTTRRNQRCRLASVQRTERVLVRAILAAKRDGVRIICNDFVVIDYGSSRVLGVCAVEAYRHFAPRGARLALPENHARHFEARDAIQVGFDGWPRGAYPKLWHALGVKLRKRFKPVPANEVAT